MPLTPEDVRNKQFTTVRLREGYDEDEGDAFLDEVEAELTRLLRENEDLRAKLEGHGVYVTRRGDDIVLNMPGDITFASGSADLSASFMPVLNDVGTILNQYPSTYIDIVGYADSQGSDAYNLDLSNRRANAVAGYLVGQKVKAERIYVAGMGEAHPIASNDTPEGRAKNRRVEITLRPVE